MPVATIKTSRSPAIVPIPTNGACGDARKGTTASLNLACFSPTFNTICTAKKPTAKIASAPCTACAVNLCAGRNRRSADTRPHTTVAVSATRQITPAEYPKKLDPCRSFVAPVWLVLAATTTRPTTATTAPAGAHCANGDRGRKVGCSRKCGEDMAATSLEDGQTTSVEKPPTGSPDIEQCVLWLADRGRAVNPSPASEPPDRPPAMRRMPSPASSDRPTHLSKWKRRRSIVTPKDRS